MNAIVPIARAELTPKQKEANRLLGSTAANVMLRGGSRSGKTFLIVRAVIQRALNAPGSRHAIFRFRFNHAKTTVWADTIPTVLRLCFPGLIVHYDKTDFFIRLPNGSEIWIAGLDDKERVEKILGFEFATLYFNESSQIPWSSVEVAMSRLAQKVAVDPAIARKTGRPYLRPKAFFDCNPPSKLHWSYQAFKAKVRPGTKEAMPNPDDWVEMKINPADNAANISEEYFARLASLSSAQRMRFEAGEWANNVNGALWALDDRIAEDGGHLPGLDSLRITPDQMPEMERVVIAVDPAGTKTGDQHGIVAMGSVGRDGYVLEDATMGGGPGAWARTVANLYDKWGADCVVGERNFGGDMVEHVIRTENPDLRYIGVNASRGKHIRAEPIAALYEQGRIHHVGNFYDLEDQMCNMTAQGYLGDGSPDRLDAMVWAGTELMLGVEGYEYDMQGMLG